MIRPGTSHTKGKAKPIKNVENANA